MGNTSTTIGDNINTTISSLNIERRAATGNEIQIIKLHQRRIQERYDSNNKDHVASLQRIWKLANFEGEFSQKNEQWRLIGFQGDDPISDLRGGGMLALDSILYHIENKQEGRNILRKRMEEYLLYVDGMHSQSQTNQTYQNLTTTSTQRSSTGNGKGSLNKTKIETMNNDTPAPQFFPFAAAGINLTRVLAEELHIVDVSGRIDPCAYNNLQKERFWHIFRETNLFYELYSWTFQVLDKVWEEEGDKSYMAFSVILSTTRMILHSVLNEPFRDNSRFPIPRHLLPMPMQQSTDIKSSTPNINNSILSTSKRLDKRFQLELDKDLNPSISSRENNSNNAKEDDMKRRNSTNYYDFSSLPSVEKTVQTKSSEVNNDPFTTSNPKPKSTKTHSFYPEINPSTKKMKVNPDDNIKAKNKSPRGNLNSNSTESSSSLYNRQHDTKIIVFNNNNNSDNSSSSGNMSSNSNFNLNTKPCMRSEKTNKKTSTNPFDIYDIDENQKDFSNDFNPFEEGDTSAARVI